MPLYEYRCDACNHEFEALQKISDEPLVHCPACEAPELRKLVSAVGFRLKGQGWYETDFKTGNKRNLAEGGGASDSAKKTEAAACGAGCGCH
jgi:putative FmdB family regulatory protein